MKLSAFSVNTIFVVLMLLGASLIPRLSLQLYPSSRSQELSVSFSWANANPELLEMEVTSKLEGAFARTKGLRDITSNTRQGWGSVTLSIDENENVDAIKLYLSSIVRSIKPSLPDGVSVSEVRGGEFNDGKATVSEQPLLLNYVITGPGSTQDVATFAEDNIAALISQMPGIESVTVTGAIPFEWVLTYDSRLLADIGVSAYDISKGIQTYYLRKDAGKVLLETEPQKKYSYIIFKGNPDDDKNDLLSLPIKTVEDKIVYLKDVASLDYRESIPSSYYRINGLNRININIFSEKNANAIDLVAKVKEEMKTLSDDFSEEYSVKMTYDSTVELKDELNQNLIRTAITILILLLFVWITSRSFRYLLIITICLTANILIALAFYYWLKIEIHLYALAGVTVSFGIIIDNVIVMADHYRHHKNLRVFMAILAATLTTMGALVVIFNMDNEVMRNMWGFSAVIIANLTVSIFVALFFVPALMEKIPLKAEHSKRLFKRRRRIVRYTRGYAKTIVFTKRFKTILAILIVLGFGIPVFLIPTTIDREKKGSEMYNRIFSSEIYLKIKPWTDKIFGGSLRLFIEGGGGQWMKDDKQERARTTLNLVMTMPHGATLLQMNEAFQKVENYIAGFPEVETFISNIYSPNRSTMNITFREEDELTGFPEMLKNELIRFVQDIGNADSEISGVGRGFSNKMGEYRSESLKVIGYNYRKVLIYAEELKSMLEEQRRVKKLYIGNSRTPDKSKEFAVQVDKEKLAKNNSDIKSTLWHLSSFSKAGDIYSSAMMNQRLTPLVIRPAEDQETSLWDIRNRPMKGNNSVYRLNDVGTIEEEQAFENITKTNQEYEVLVQYDFLGDYMLSSKIKERVMKEMNKTMPVGFRVKDSDRWNWSYWKGAGGIDKRVWYILLVITIIYFICSVLLESFRQAFIVIIIAPISFIGCFLGFYFFGLKFNEGGLAAFILMCGLAVNSILYIINDYNNKLRDGRPAGLHTYLRAYNAKIIPIFLTIVSTMLGFIPFLVGKPSDFWFSLALGTISGLAFSLLVLIILLPIFFVPRKQITKGYRHLLRKNKKLQLAYAGNTPDSETGNPEITGRGKKAGKSGKIKKIFRKLNPVNWRKKKDKTPVLPGQPKE